MTHAQHVSMLYVLASQKGSAVAPQACLTGSRRRHQDAGSKQLAMSASSTYRGRLWIVRNICCIASWHERPGLKPKLFGSNFASHAGSAASLTSACVARSCMIGTLQADCTSSQVLFRNDHDPESCPPPVWPHAAAPQYTPGGRAA
jgi:hypothetical protein